MGRAWQAFESLGLADLTVLNRTEQGIEFVHLHLRDAHVVQKMLREGLELIRRRYYPVQHRVRVHLEYPGDRTNAQPFGQGPHHQLGGDARAMQGRAMGFEKIAPAGHALQLPPPSTTGMTVGADIAQSDPAVIITAWSGAELVLCVHRSWTSPDGDHRWRGRRECLGWLLCFVLTSGAGWLIGETWKWLRCV